MDVSSRHPTTGVTEIAVRGELDMATAPLLRQAVVDALACDGVRSLVVDLTETGFCDSSGIAVLDLGYDTAERKGVRFRITGVQPPVRRVLQIVGVLDLLTGP